MQECIKELDKTRYACFAHPEHSSQTPAPQRGQRRPSWRNLFSSRGFSAPTPEIPLEVFESLQIIVNDDDGQPRIESFSVRPLYSHHLPRPDSPRKLGSPMVRRGRSERDVIYSRTFPRPGAREASGLSYTGAGLSISHGMIAARL